MQKKGTLTRYLVRKANKKFFIFTYLINPATSLKTFVVFGLVLSSQNLDTELKKKSVASGNLKLSHEIKIDKINQSVIGPALSNRGDLIEIMIKRVKKDLVEIEYVIFRLKNLFHGRFSEFQKVSH